MGADGVGERDEQPRHTVTIPGFWLDKLEVTNREYLECVHAGACAPYGAHVAEAMRLGPEARFRKPEQPVVGVSWYDASAYCKWRGKRLPREAEWEKAARGEDERAYPWGNQRPDPERLACFSASKGGTTRPVGSFPEGHGPYGHLDLAGNVWEWTADYYDPYAYQRATRGQGEPGTCAEILKAQDELRASGQQGYTGTNPIPTECERVLRGGAFNYDAPGLRASNRVHHGPNFRLVVAGFRCAGRPASVCGTLSGHCAAVLW
jgi:formylglycine-generating enzyme required for sulfatase activity